MGTVLKLLRIWNNRIRKVSPPPNAAASPTSLTFSKQVVGTTSSPQTITLSNTGPQLLAIFSISVSGTNASDFGVTHDCGSTLASKLNCTISVTFTPTAAGISRTAILTIMDTSSDSPQTIQLSGTGSTPTETVNLSPASLNFGTILEGTTSATQSVTLGNAGNNSLNISKFSVLGSDYSQTDTCGTSVAPGASCTIAVSYTPSSSGMNQTRIDITDDGLNSPQSISLSGSGTEFLLAPTAGSSTTQTVTAGNTAYYSLTLSPSSGTRDTVTLSCSGAPATVICSVQPSTQTFTSSAPVPVTVTVSTTARSVLSPAPTGRLFPQVTAARIAFLFAYLAFVVSLFKWSRRFHHARSLLTLHRPAWPKAIVLFGAVSFVLMAAGCGGGGGSSSPQHTGTPAGTYNLTVTAKSASSTNPDQTVPLTLTVQ